jgi:hypothetical protein
VSLKLKQQIIITLFASFEKYSNYRDPTNSVQLTGERTKKEFHSSKKQKSSTLEFYFTAFPTD